MLSSFVFVLQVMVRRMASLLGTASSTARWGLDPPWGLSILPRATLRGGGPPQDLSEWFDLPCLWVWNGSNLLWVHSAWVQAVGATAPIVPRQPQPQCRAVRGQPAGS